MALEAYREMTDRPVQSHTDSDVAASSALAPRESRRPPAHLHGNRRPCESGCAEAGHSSSSWSHRHRLLHHRRRGAAVDEEVEEAVNSVAKDDPTRALEEADPTLFPSPFRARDPSAPDDAAATAGHEDGDSPHRTSALALAPTRHNGAKTIHTPSRETSTRPVSPLASEADRAETPSHFPCPQRCPCSCWIQCSPAIGCASASVG